MPLLDAYKIRYCLVGGFNTIFGYINYIILLQLFPYYIAYSISFAMSVIISYCLNTTVVFKTEFSWMRFFMFPAVYLIQYCIGLSMLHVFIIFMHLSPLIAPIIVTAVTWPISFMLSRLILTHEKTRSIISS